METDCMSRQNSKAPSIINAHLADYTVLGTLGDDITTEEVPLERDVEEALMNNVESNLADPPDTENSSEYSTTSTTWPLSLKIPHNNNLSHATIRWTKKLKKTVKLLLIVTLFLLTLVLLYVIALLKLQIAVLGQAHNNPASIARDDFIFKTSLGGKEKSEEFSQSTTSSTSASLPTECPVITASSVAEYEEKLQNIPVGKNVCLVINSNDTGNWNMQNFSVETEMVKEVVLVGCFHMTFLSEILEKFNCASKITFGQADHMFCDRNPKFSINSHPQPTRKTKIYLLNLTEIVFESINCTAIFEFLPKAFHMNGVTCLKIKRMSIDQSCVTGLRQLLKQLKYSLEILHFCDVVWKVALFDKFSFEVPNLVELQMDFVSNNDANIKFLQGFHTAVKLLKIKSLKGFLPYEQFHSIHKFKMMRHLVLGVEISDQVTSLDNLFPLDSLANLQSMELFLKFRNSAKCYLLSDYNIKRSYRIRLHSNCDVDFGI